MCISTNILADLLTPYLPFSHVNPQCLLNQFLHIAYLHIRSLVPLRHIGLMSSG